MPSRVPKFDRRLLGTWKSDRQRTFRHFVPGSGATPEGIHKFKALFGKMTIRWGYRHYHTDLDGSKKSQPYEFVARDSESVFIRHFDSLSQDFNLCTFTSTVHTIGSGHGAFASTSRRSNASPPSPAQSSSPAAQCGQNPRPSAVQ